MAEKKTLLIRSAIVPGKIDHFRAVMQRLIIQYHQETWRSSTGQRLFFHESRQTKREVVGVQDITLPYSQPKRWSRPVNRTVDVTPSTRGTWQVHTDLFQNKHLYAAIEAYEQPDGQSTRLDFIDGYYPSGGHTVRDQIGVPFAEFAEMIVHEAQSAQSNGGDRQHDVQVDQTAIRLPVTNTTIERVAAFILDFSTEYQLANHQVGAQVPIGGDGTLFDLYFYLRRALTDEEKIAHDIPSHIQNAETFDNQKCGTIRIKAGIVIGQVVLECNPLTDSAKQFVDALADRLRADQQDAQPAEPRVGNTRQDGKPNKGGRPPYVEDEWAFAELESGRPRNEVVKEWLGKAKASGREFADPQDSFDKQMKAVRKRREKTARSE